MQPKVNRSLSHAWLDDVDHAQGRPADPLGATLCATTIQDESEAMKRSHMEDFFVVVSDRGFKAISCPSPLPQREGAHLLTI